MKDFTETGIALVDQAKALSIKTEEDYGVAEALGKVMSKEIKEIKDYFKPMKADAKKAHQNIVNAEKFSLEEYEKAKGILKVAMLGYEAVQEAIRREKEAKLRKELEAKQETERLIADVEGRDIEPLIAPEDIVVAPTFERKGQTRDNWKAEVTHFEDLAEYAVSHRAWDLIVADMATLNGYAKLAKKESLIPGVRFYNDFIKIF